MKLTSYAIYGFATGAAWGGLWMHLHMPPDGQLLFFMFMSLLNVGVFVMEWEWNKCTNN